MIGVLVVALVIYWSRKLSLILQRNVAQAINFRLMTLNAGPVDPITIDETAWAITDGGRNHRVEPIKWDAVVAVTTRQTTFRIVCILI